MLGKSNSGEVILSVVFFLITILSHFFLSMRYIPVHDIFNFYFMEALPLFFHENISLFPQNILFSCKYLVILKVCT